MSLVPDTYVAILDPVCSWPWALVPFTEPQPRLSVGVVFSDGTVRELRTYFTDVDEGPDVSGYTVDALVELGMAHDVATLLYDGAGGADAGNSSGAPGPAPTSNVPCVSVAHRDVAAAHDAVWDGEIVRRLQQRLVDLGHGGAIMSSGGIDGQFGNGTRDAFESYRQSTTIDLGGFILPTGEHGWLITATALPLIGVDCR